ncbi:MAG: acyltransferase [Acutalibacteraceae bacterium]
MKKDRIVYLDYLRLFAIIAVIILHVAALNWSNLNGRSLEWNVFNFYDGVVRWGVPIFVMISGALFLEKEIETKKLYSKYILRLVIAYFVWSAFYAVGISFGKLLLDSRYQISYKILIADLIEGAYHMWFIPMIIGIYMCVPIIKQIVKSKEVTKYFLILSFVFAFIIPQVKDLSNDFIGGLFSAGVNSLSNFVLNMKMNLVLGYTFYFILGYVLNNIEFTKKQRKIVYFLGAVGFLSTVLLNAIVAWKTNLPCKTYYSNFSVNVLFEAVAVHTWFKYRDYKHIKLNSIFSKLSKYSFGAYLVHVFVMSLLDIIGVDTLAFLPFISVPVISAIVVIISFAISFLINQIPIINKWIV